MCTGIGANLGAYGIYTHLHVDPSSNVNWERSSPRLWSPAFPHVHINRYIVICIYILSNAVGQRPCPCLRIPVGALIPAGRVIQTKRYITWLSTPCSPYPFSAYSAWCVYFEAFTLQILTLYSVSYLPLLVYVHIHTYVHTRDLLLPPEFSTWRNKPAYAKICSLFAGTDVYYEGVPVQEMNIHKVSFNIAIFSCCRTCTAWLPIFCFTFVTNSTSKTSEPTAFSKDSLKRP